MAKKSHKTKKLLLILSSLILVFLSIFVWQKWQQGKDSTTKIFTIEPSLTEALNFTQKNLEQVFFWQKWPKSMDVAKILPENTFAFFEIELQKKSNWSNLKNQFSEIALSEILEIDPILVEVLNFAQKRVGIGFVGTEFSPQNFVIILDVKKPTKVLDFLKTQTALKEELLIQKIGKQKIFLYPRSRTLTFTFQGKDLILTSNLDVLQEILTSPRSLSESPKFQIIQHSEFTPVDNFGFIATSLFQELIQQNLTGFQQLLGLEILKLWENFAFTLSAQESGVKIDFQGFLTPAAIQQKIFLELEEQDSLNLEFINSKTKIFLASQNLAAQFSNFLTKLEKQNPSLKLLIQGLLQKLQTDFLGPEFNFPLQEIFQQNFILGKTFPGDIFAFFLTENLPELEKSLLNAQGLLAAQEKIISLPDGTLAKELSQPDAPPLREEVVFAGFKVVQLIFANFVLNFFNIQNQVLMTTNPNLFQNFNLDLTLKETTNILPKFLNTKAPNLFYLALAEKRPAILQPFHFLFSSLEFGTKNCLLEIFFSTAKLPQQIKVQN